MNAQGIPLKLIIPGTWSFPLLLSARLDKEKEINSQKGKIFFKKLVFPRYLYAGAKRNSTARATAARVN